MGRIYSALVFAGILFTAGGLAHADSSAAESPKLAALEALVNNLGYTTTEADDKSSFSFTYQGKSSYDITFNLSKDEASAYGYVPLSTISPAQMANAPFVKMMEFNDGGDAYFSMENHPDHESLYLNTILGTSGLTPQLLRERLDSFTSDIDETQNLWDPTTWKKP